MAGEQRATSNYITPEGFEKLRAEHEQLWRVERPKVTQAVSVAAALGDRSENADYIYGNIRVADYSLAVTGAYYNAIAGDTVDPV